MSPQRAEPPNNDPSTDDPAEIADAWIEHTRRSRGDEAYAWARDHIYIIARNDPEQVWTIILHLVERSPDDHILGNVAAGPLETFVSYHAVVFIDRIEVQAERD